MANGDAAAAAGLATFAPTQDIRMGYDNDNIRGDELAAHLTSGTHPASAISSGILNVARIPNLDASKISGGDLTVNSVNSVQETSRVVNVVNASNVNTIQLVGSNGASAFTGQMNVSGVLNVTNTLQTTGVITSSNQIYTSNSFRALGNCWVDGTLIGGAVSVSGNITGANTYNQTNTGRAMYVNSAGLYGIGASARRFKKNIVDAEIDVQEVLKIRVRNFMYKKEYDEDQDVHIGVIAEELQELGLDQFVYFNADGEPDGVAYEKLALALIPVIQNQEERLQALESKVN